MKGFEDDFPPFEDPEVYPPSASTQGSNGRYLDYCFAVAHRPAYAACLNRVAAWKTHSLDQTLYADCQRLMDRDECPALAMRKEEIEMGRALYFLNTKKLNRWIEERAVWLGAKVAALFGSTPKKPQETPAATKLPVTTIHSEQDDYALALNRAFQKHTEKSHDDRTQG